MPKAVRVPLQVAAGFLLCPGLLLLLAFPVVLAAKFPTQPIVAFLGLVLAAGGAPMMAGGVRSWLHTRPRTLHTLIHRTPLLWAGLFFFVWGGLLCLFRWPFLEVFAVLSAIVVGPLLMIGCLLPGIRDANRYQRARQAQAPAQENAPARRRDSPLFIASVLLGCVLGYALFALTLNGQLAAFLIAHLSYQPPFAPIPFWVFATGTAASWVYSLLIQVPASLRWRPPRQRFLFLLARRVFGVVIVFYAIFIALELSHRLSEGEGDLFFATLLTLGAIAGLTYLAAWAVVWLSRWRAARHREA